MSLESFPRYPLTFGPSPVHRRDRLTEHLGGAAVWAKREDVNSGLAFGGNKTRKLEYLVEAQERDLGVFFDTIIVCSVIGSTQAGMVAGFAEQARERRVIGIEASARPAETRAQIARIARFTASAIGVERDLREDEVRRREIPTTSTVLHAHLGGQPALNGYASLFS